MQRTAVFSSVRLNRLLLTARPQKYFHRTIASQHKPSTPSSVEIKSNVPEFWVRKMKTFFAFYDQNGDGVINDRDYSILEERMVSNAIMNNVSKERIEKFKAKRDGMWIDKVAGGSKEFEMTENRFLEVIFEVVNRPGVEEYFRQAACELFDLMDLNEDGFISKMEMKTVRGGDPWSIVSFAAMDTSRNGEVSRKEFVEVYIDFWFNFADESTPSKHFMGPLVKF